MRRWAEIGGVRGFLGDVMIRFGALEYARDKRVSRDW